MYILWGDLLSLNENVIFWRFFIIFNILNVFVQWKNGKFQSPKSSTGTSISVASLLSTYTRLKSVISSFKICFQNYGQLKRKFLRPKNTSSTFLKFELYSLSGPMSSAFINQDVFIQQSDII